MSDTTDEKIGLLVRSVLAAVDARLSEVRSEIQAVAADVETRHSDVLRHLQALELRWDTRATETGQMAVGDPLASRMEQATQVLLERIEAMHQRNTIATNERFALMNDALKRLSGDTIVRDAESVTMPSLDAMNAPLRVGPPTGQVPVASTLPSAVTLPPIPPLTSAPPKEPSNEPYEPIDMGRLADLLSERLGSLSLPPQQQN